MPNLRDLFQHISLIVFNMFVNKILEIPLKFGDSLAKPDPWLLPTAFPYEQRCTLIKYDWSIQIFICAFFDTHHQRISH